VLFFDETIITYSFAVRFLYRKDQHALGQQIIFFAGYCFQCAQGFMIAALLLPCAITFNAKYPALSDYCPDLGFDLVCH
ncbi:MAG: hypothetical protein ACK4S8_08525, partial [Alishewanella aestuarii]